MCVIVYKLESYSLGTFLWPGKFQERDSAVSSQHSYLGEDSLSLEEEIWVAYNILYMGKCKRWNYKTSGVKYL